MLDNQQGQQPPWPQQQPSTPYPLSYQQLPQYQRPYFQQLLYYSPPQPLDKPKNKTMKTLAIISFSVGLFLAFFSVIPTIGVVFGFFGFFCNVMGLIFLCCV